MNIDNKQAVRKTLVSTITFYEENPNDDSYLQKLIDDTLLQRISTNAFREKGTLNSYSYPCTYIENKVRKAIEEEVKKKVIISLKESD